MADRLAVVLSGDVVGHLSRTREGDDPTFTYTESYVHSGTVALSSQLPIQREAHPPRKVAPYLAGLIPESEDARSAWSDRLEVSPDDTFGILASMGWDCPGAVQFCREEDLDQLFARSGEFEPVTDAQIARRIRDLAVDQASWTMPDEHWSLGGQQEKFALTLIGNRWHAAHGSAPTTHIFKPGIRHLHHQALIEHVTMMAAAKVGILVANSNFSQFEDQWAIVIDRFDRRQLDGHIIRVHQEDFAQACGRMPIHKYEARGGPGLADMMRVIVRESTSLQDDRLALADFLVVNLISGAPDGHSKNISLLRAAQLIAIAPLYDLATGLAYDSRRVERTVAVSIGGERMVSRIRYRQWEKAADKLGLESELLIRRVRTLARHFPSAFEQVLSDLPSEVPGITEIAERTIPPLAAHCQLILDQL